jgi:hypothetical protein
MWAGGANVGTAYRKFEGRGTATLMYGNCWDSGVVTVYRTNYCSEGCTASSAYCTLLSSAGPNTYRVVEFEYENNSCVQVRDEGANSVAFFEGLFYYPKG